jgi:hypothetical protein
VPAQVVTQVAPHQTMSKSESVATAPIGARPDALRYDRRRPWCERCGHPNARFIELNDGTPPRRP